MRVSLAPGRCRWCQCTEARGCPLGCHWVDDRMTCCSACADLDRLMRTAAGRQRLAEVVHDYADEALGARR